MVHDDGFTTNWCGAGAQRRLCYLPGGLTFVCRICAGCLTLGLNLVRMSGFRVKWRPYMSLLYKHMHQEELEMVNRIVTHFEELRNFHVSEADRIPFKYLFPQR